MVINFFWTPKKHGKNEGLNPYKIWVTKPRKMKETRLPILQKPSFAPSIPTCCCPFVYAKELARVLWPIRTASPIGGIRPQVPLRSEKKKKPGDSIRDLFCPLVGGQLTFEFGSLNQLKKVTKNCQEDDFFRIFQHTPRI